MKFMIQHMTVEYLENPLAVDTAIPRFGWWLEAEENGLLQKAYRILVKEGDTVIWDSGKTDSDRQFHVEYEGKALKPLTEYNWELTVYDQDGDSCSRESRFETAFLKDQKAAFEGANWIGNGAELPLYADYLSVFRMEHTFRFSKDSMATGFYYGADDPRLLKKDRNLLEMENRPGESYVKIVVNAEPLLRGEQAVLSAYRSGYAPEDDPALPLYTVQIPQAILHAENMYEPHALIMDSVYGQSDFYLDIAEQDRSLLGAPTGNLMEDMVRRWNLNPIGRGGDYISFPAAGKIGIYAPKGKQSVCESLAIRNFRAPHAVLYCGVPEEVNRFYDVSHGGNTMLRTVFSVEKEIRRARVYATARGVYNLYLNGSQVGSDYLAPGLSQYDKHQYYQVYDVTEQLTEGGNCLGAVLAEGWFSGSISYTGENWNYFGDRNSLLLQLRIEYTDGTDTVICSNPETFTMFTGGPVIYSSIFQGEVFDCRKDWILHTFTLPSYDASNWSSAEIIPCNETTSCLAKDVITPFGTVQPGLDYSDLQLHAQPDTGVRETERLTAVELLEPRPGVYIYDMGQNMAGVPCIHINGREGQEIILRFAEVLYPDLPEYEGKTGTMMLENIRGAMATDRFILRDGEQILKPLFTYHGYRYVEITGIEQPLELAAVQGISISSMPKLAAEFTCSDPMINRLYQNVGWSLRDNYISIPSDCPQRNERMGWSGDLSVFGRTAVYMSESEPFLMRHMAALRDTQVNGRFGDIAPIGGGFGGTLWGSVGVTVPWEMYLHYGDKRVLEEMFPAMYSYLQFLFSKKDANGIVKDGPLGDWLGPENTKNESAFLWQAYYVYDLHIVLEAARLLGKAEEEKWLEAEYADALQVFRTVYIDEETGLTVYSDYDSAMSLNTPFGGGTKEKEPEQTASGKYIIDTQTSYAVPLALGLLEGNAKDRAEEYLNRCCTRSNCNDLKQECPPYTLMTGFIGTSWISQALSNAGCHETAWRMLRSTDYPSWLYPVKNGATTIWERLNSYTAEDGFGGNNSMNSFNHYSFGAVAAWMLGYAGGVRRAEDPGSFAIRPIPDPDSAVTFTECKVQTVQGEYRVRWEKDGEAVIYTFHIPGGKNTEVELPLGSRGEEAAETIRNIAGTENIRISNGSVRFRAVPGDYMICI
ncbi:MAG: family 78 glycoside hydrolase catalytic domain [Eubacteriales bacterium]|nr:family 78 glycoside hydrolase catalytic domain [Eubacteriales bacterium]